MFEYFTLSNTLINTVIFKYDPHALEVKMCKLIAKHIFLDKRMMLWRRRKWTRKRSDHPKSWCATFHLRRRSTKSKNYSGNLGNMTNQIHHQYNAITCDSHKTHDHFRRKKDELYICVVEQYSLFISMEKLTLNDIYKKRLYNFSLLYWVKFWKRKKEKTSC